MLRAVRFICPFGSLWQFRLKNDELVHEKERYKSISEELDQTFQELSGY
jgi:hypothetical protein